MKKKTILFPILIAFLVTSGPGSWASEEEPDTPSRSTYNPGPDGWSHSKGERPHTFFQPNEKFKIYQGRPRLMIRDTDMPWLRKRIAGELKPTWDFIYKKAKGKWGIQQEIKNYAWRPKNWAWTTQYIAIAGLMTQEKEFIDWCLEWAKQMAPKPCYRKDDKTGKNVSGNDTYINTRLQCLAVIYDWFYDHFSEKDRKFVREGMIEHVKWLYAHPMVRGIGHTGGHDRGCIQALGVAMVALYPDYRNDEYLQYIREHLHGVYKATSYIARDGSYYMGWGTYTPGYTEIQKLLGWTTGTNDVLLDDWMAEKAWWYIYGRRGDNLFPAMEDTGSNYLMPIRTSHTLYAVHFNKNPYARWNYEELGFGGEKDFKWLNKLLFWDESVPRKPFTDLPLSRAFWGSGHVICRDSWDEKATHMVFRSVPFTGGNHRHHDQNSFIIHYKGQLLIDSGRFGETPGQYAYSSIAHNCMYFKPPEGKKFRISDGEQKRYPSRMGWKRKYQEITKGSISDIRGLYRYQSDDRVTYMAGEATKVYVSKLVELSQREIAYIRKSEWDHPVIIVHDRNGTQLKEIEKRSLLHFVNEPLVKGSTFSASHKGGKLAGSVVFPAGPAIEKIGGPGKEFWKYGKNLSPREQKPVSKDGHNPGAWRLEIYSKEKSTHDNMVYALFVDDADSEKTPPGTERIEGDGVLGVNTAGWVVVFGKTENAPGAFSYTAGKKGGNQTHLITGLVAGNEYSIECRGVKTTLAAGKGGAIKTQISSKAGDVIKVSCRK